MEDSEGGDEDDEGRTCLIIPWVPCGSGLWSSVFLTRAAHISLNTGSSVSAHARLTPAALSRSPRGRVLLFISQGEQNRFIFLLVFITFALVQSIVPALHASYGSRVLLTSLHARSGHQCEVVGVRAQAGNQVEARQVGGGRWRRSSAPLP